MSDDRRSRTHAWYVPRPDREALRRLSGLEYLRRLLESERLAPPIGALLGFRLVSVDHGRATFEGEPAEYHYNPLATVHGGFAATLLDSAMGCAVHTTCAPGHAFTTIEIKVNYVKAMTADTGLVVAEGRTIAVGSRIATAEGRLTDREGRILAHGTTTCLIFAL